MRKGKNFIRLIMVAFISVCITVPAMADADTEWEPVIPLPYGNEAVERFYVWNDNDDAITQVRGIDHNLYMDEENAEIKLIASDYTLVMTGLRQPLGELDEDGSALIGVYYWESDSEIDEDINEKISLIGEYPIRTRYLGDNQVSVYLNPNEPLNEDSFQRNFDRLKEMCNID